MTEIKLNGKTIIPVEVPDGAESVELNMPIPELLIDRWYVDYWLFDKYIDIDLPPAKSYTILFETKKATEEDWRGLMPNLTPSLEPSYEDYVQSEIRGFTYKVETATESGHSLLRANGLDPDKNYLIIEKIEK